MLASLNHPHIGAIYGLEDADGVTALVMELVEGDDLSQRIARGAIPIAEALPIARQIAEALEAAHEQGIIHRDLKPANIKVRPDGTVKVLDFGLAKALDPTSTSSAEMMNSPTFTPPSTMMGTIIGTAAYMAPEQARGKAVDRRADIWAFGVVVYEMLTGRRPFDGDDTSTTLASVLKDDVSWQALPADLPAPAHRMLRRCLEKDPRRRLSAIGDARIELEDAMAAPAEPALLPTPRRGSRLALSALVLGIATPLFSCGCGATGSEGHGAIAAGYSRHTSHGSSRPRGVSGHIARRQVGGVHRRRGRQTTGLRAAHCRRRAAANHARSSRSRIPSLVARLELDPVFFAGGIRNRPGEHLGDPGAWRRAAAGRQQRGRCRRQPERWTACALPAGEAKAFSW